ncbi:monoamine oxidase [Arcticibacter tournemirensis]|uniref:Tryptophan 2-monooxygenase n=1 Tax=Arcticibacter tournemirensis TaxID=699437 RepID=A0A5M9HBF4_9SPHI|nr:NAD(P)/FAD-dependent oxidoreductase [Arcticibacter tournemirensis]KAA8482584.1 FAD-dependent oxidoreductase [Arcticibacter tournemirensis]TQM52553.1 monoamine oxidase [Arcticibacter tournemirensis]
MPQFDVLIVGAGISGLAAARKLTRDFKKVLILEAADRAGGRIADLREPGFPQPVMLGAEFIHGKLPLTMALLKEAGIHYYPVDGKSVRMFKGKEQRGDEDDWSLVMEKLKSLKEDISLSEFLSRYIGGEKYEGLRESVLDFAKGFDAADPDYASSLSLSKEWQQEEGEQYRIEGGYGRLIDFMESECLLYGAEICYRETVKKVNWRTGFAEVITSSGNCYSAEKIIITVPVGVLKMEVTEPGAIEFNPPLPERIALIRSIGFGSVIKAVLYFEGAFWEAKTGTDTGFIFSDEAFPTWWTQYPLSHPVLTGWLGGPDAESYRNATEDELLEMALHSLSRIFDMERAELKKSLLAFKISNWAANPFANGAYTYPTVSVPQPSEVLAAPVADTIYFAGEAAYQGIYGGTVEAALASTLGLLSGSEELEITSSNS